MGIFYGLARSHAYMGQKGKARFFRFLAIKDEYFSDDLKRLDDEKIVVRLLSHWIIEMSEMLAVLNSRRYEEYKSFLSRQKDTYRTPYEKHPKDRLRQCVFGAAHGMLENIQDQSVLLING